MRFCRKTLVLEVLSHAFWENIYRLMIFLCYNFSINTRISFLRWEVKVMGDEPEKKMLKRICAGLLAHVDAGKTTLSEALLYESGQLRRLGRVDHRDAFLDTDAQERERGITIFSKQARLSLDGLDLTLLDTPGHVDFSSEMERTLQVLDYASLPRTGRKVPPCATTVFWRSIWKRGTWMTGM